MISAAFALSPYPSPSAIPAASAITFFSDPPSSMPSISGLVYTRKTSFINNPCRYSAVSRVFAPTTTLVGSPLPTSSAWLGPERTATSASGNSSSICWLKVISVFSSIPFATSTTICPLVRYGLILAAVLRTAVDGTAMISTSLPVTASSKSPVNLIVSGSFTPGSFDLCSLVLLSSSASSGLCDHSVTACPFLSRSNASAVPQLPAPITPIFAILYLLIRSYSRL